ncbi:MAG: hypothetical protein ACXV3D_10195 [Halobacteriota archaeon]
MKRSVFRLIVVLLAATVLTAVVITYFPHSSKSDYSADFAKSIEGAGWTPINPVSQTADNVYSGLYRVSSGNSSGNGSAKIAVTIEIAQSEAAANERYGQLVLQKQNAGYTSGESNLGSSTILGDTKASWFGYKTNSLKNTSTYTFLYAYNAGISNWVVVSESEGTLSNSSS